MADKDAPMLEKFSGSEAREWVNWLDDYETYGELKKWNNEKLVANLRFFVSGDIKDCLRQICADSEKAVTLEELSKEVVKLLGGDLDPISAVQQLDSVVCLGNVRRTLLQIHALIPVAYPTLTAKADKEQMCLLHLLKLPPHSFKHELVKAGVTTLELAVVTVEGMERANRVMGEQTGLNRVVTQPDAPVKVEFEDKTSSCFVCGLSDHWRAMCPFRQDICGRCEKRGHLSAMCRGTGVSRSQGNSSWSAKGQGQARERGTAPPAAQQRRQQLHHQQWPLQQQQQPQLHHQQRPLQQLPPEQLMGHPVPVGMPAQPPSAQQQHQ